MTKYIDIDEADGRAYDILETCTGQSPWEAARAMQKIYQDSPAADVRPVVRGKWINRGKNSLFPDDTIWACSECDSIYFTRLRFCPYCGADMRELEKYSTDNK